MSNPWAGRANKVPIHLFGGNHREAEMRFAYGSANERIALTQLANEGFERFWKLQIDLINAHRQGASQIDLSGFGNFPDSKQDGLPVAAMFDDPERIQVDLRWLALYRLQDMTGSPSPHFQMFDLYNAVTYDQYGLEELGQEMNFYTVQGSRNTFTANVISGGYQFNKVWERWNPMFSPDQGVAAAMSKWGAKQAQLGYDTITGAAYTSIAYDTAGSNQIEKDINTLNLGIKTIEDQLWNATNPKDAQKLEEEIAGAVYYALYNAGSTGLKSRMARAVAAGWDRPNDSNSTVKLDSPVVLIPTRRVSGSDITLVLGGRKNVYAPFLPFQMRTFDDVKAVGVNVVNAGEGAYLHVAGDANQGVTLASST